MQKWELRNSCEDEIFKLSFCQEMALPKLLLRIWRKRLGGEIVHNSSCTPPWYMDQLILDQDSCGLGWISDSFLLWSPLCLPLPLAANRLLYFWNGPTATFSNKTVDNNKKTSTKTNHNPLHSSAVQQPEPAENNSGAGVHERDPEALPDYPDNLQTTPPDHPDQTTLPDHPDQTNLPNHPDQTNLPDYSDQPSPSAPPSELRTVLPSATDVATLAVPARSIEDVLETPPSYEAVMRGEFWQNSFEINHQRCVPKTPFYVNIKVNRDMPSKPASAYILQLRRTNQQPNRVLTQSTI